MIIFILSAFGLLCALGGAYYYGRKEGYNKGQAALLLQQRSERVVRSASVTPEFEHLTGEAAKYFPRN